MATKRKNPYREGSAYHAIFAFILSLPSQIVSKAQLTDKGFAPADINVVLSPKPEGESKGDCRGNFSAAGHLYCFKPLKRKQGEDQRYRLHWRKIPLDKHSRPRKG